MGWFNYYGLAIFVLLMIPNYIYSIKNKEGFENKFDNKPLEFCEQVGRFGSFIFLIFNVPKLYVGFWFDKADLIYLVVNGILLMTYLTVWALMWKKSNLTRALLLSITPSLIFIFSGVMVVSYPLIALSVIFAITHITISVKNVK